MRDIASLTKKIIEFRNKRDWKQFHNPKDIAISLSLEAGELLEHFQWKDSKEVSKYVQKNKDAISEEIADVLYWILLISHDLRINPLNALRKKLAKNENKYPVEKSKGRHTKYTEL